MSLLEKRRSGKNCVRKNDFRTPYERDYARIIHSAAFRRLQNKTQVLCLGESDFYRTRLTHSIEVAQIGSGINTKLKNDKQNIPQELFDSLPCDRLIQAICLAHDIGNPPFGHGGETALNKLMMNEGGFEGNGQTLRILSKLGKYSDSHGMDVTRRTLLGVMKYPCNYSRLSNLSRYTETKKFNPPKCYLDDEVDVFDWITDYLSPEDQRLFQTHDDPSKDSKGKPIHGKTYFKSLDTSIMELADDISYGVNDLEDSISVGLITEDHWKSYLEPYLNFDFGHGEKLFDIQSKLFSKKTSAIKYAIGSLINFFITQVQITRLKKDNLTFNTPLLSYNAVLPRTQKEVLDSLKSIVRERVIQDPKVQLLEYKGQQLVSQLFEVFASDPRRFLPKTTLERYKANNESIRVICDYISGMTDEYATKLYQTTFLPHCGSIFERL